MPDQPLILQFLRTVSNEFQALAMQSDNPDFANGVMACADRLNAMMEIAKAKANGDAV